MLAERFWRLRDDWLNHYQVAGRLELFVAKWSALGFAALPAFSSPAEAFEYLQRTPALLVSVYILFAQFEEVRPRGISLQEAVEVALQLEQVRVYRGTCLARNITHPSGIESDAVIDVPSVYVNSHTHLIDWRGGSLCIACVEQLRRLGVPLSVHGVAIEPRSTANHTKASVPATHDTGAMPPDLLSRITDIGFSSDQAKAAIPNALEDRKICKEVVPTKVALPAAPPGGGDHSKATQEWRIVWATICGELCEQLSPTVISTLRTAFNSHGATSVQNFFETKNSANFFTGPQARQNCEDLLRALSSWKGVNAVQKLADVVKAIR